MTISNRTLVNIAAWGGVIVGTTGFFLQRRLADGVRDFEAYKEAIKRLRSHPGAIHYLGEPIKDGRIQLTDKTNEVNANTARLIVPVKGSKDKGNFYFWANRLEEKWVITKAELELKSNPDQRLVIVREKSDTA